MLYCGRSHEEAVWQGPQGDLQSLDNSQQDKGPSILHPQGGEFCYQLSNEYLDTIMPPASVVVGCPSLWTLNGESSLPCSPHAVRIILVSSLPPTATALCPWVPGNLLSPAQVQPRSQVPESEDRVKWPLIIRSRHGP